MLTCNIGPETKRKKIFPLTSIICRLAGWGREQKFPPTSKPSPDGHSTASYTIAGPSLSMILSPGIREGREAEIGFNLVVKGAKSAG